jgi:hypothetical protein
MRARDCVPLVAVVHFIVVHEAVERVLAPVAEILLAAVVVEVVGNCDGEGCGALCPAAITLDD